MKNRSMVTYQCALKIHIGENNVPGYPRKNEKANNKNICLTWH